MRLLALMSVLPFPEMRYGFAPQWSFDVFESSLLLLLLLCLVHTMWTGRQRMLPYVIGGFLFGLLLEYLEVLSHSYTYGRFHWMLGHAPLSIPLCIGAGWGVILYASRLFSDNLQLPLAAAAALDTLLALNIDLSMDVVASRLHMWHWYWRGSGLDPLHAEWFGIPYGNFVGWATVVFCYSLFNRLLEAKLSNKARQATAFNSRGGEPAGSVFARHVAVAILALLCAQAVLFTLEAWVWGLLRRYLGISSGLRLLLIIFALLLLLATGWNRRLLRKRRAPWPSTVVPFTFHTYFLFCFLWFGFYRENRWMTIAAAVNFGVGLLLHLTPLRLHVRRSLRRNPEALPRRPPAARVPLSEGEPALEPKAFCAALRRAMHADGVSHKPWTDCSSLRCG